MKFYVQFRLLMWKNFVLQRRSPLMTFVEIALPVVSIGLLMGMRNFVRSVQYRPAQIYSFVLPTYQRGKGIVTYKFVPNTSLAREIITQVVARLVNDDLIHNFSPGLPSLDAWTVIVTGGSAGIGFHISRLLAQCGARVIIGSRCRQEAEGAISKILQEQPSAEVYFLHLDLSSFQSVRAFVEEFMKKGWPLHLLINNAGVMLVPYQVSEDGHEYHQQVNHLSHALLTSLLLPAMETSATRTRPARVINVTSVVHWVASLDPHTFGEKCESGRGYSPHNAYAASKLATLLYTKALSRRLAENKSSVVVTAAHPGVVNSALYQHVHWTVAWVFNIFKQLLFMDPEQGAVNVLQAVSCTTSECYYSNGQPATPSPVSLDQTIQDIVDRKTSRVIGLKVD